MILFVVICKQGSSFLLFCDKWASLFSVESSLNQTCVHEESYSYLTVQLNMCDGESKLFDTFEYIYLHIDNQCTQVSVTRELQLIYWIANI